MLKQIYILLLFVLAVTGLQAQNGAQQQQQQAEPAYSRKKTLRDVRSNLKAERYAQADEQIQKAWKQSEEAVRDAELYNLMVNAQRGLANAENKKIFLNNRPDTVKYFDYIYKVYDYGIRCDSLDRLPNEKGRVKTHYSSNIQSQLLSYRNNIKSAGKFFYKKRRFSDAYKYFDMYLKTRHHPLLTSAKNYTVGTDTTELAVMAVYASYSAKEYDHVKQYIQLALNDTTEFSYLCQLGSQALMELKDTVSAMDYLFEGWKNEPTHDYFFITLVDYNINQHNYQEPYDIVAAQLLEVPDNHRLWYIFGKCQQCMDSIDAAVLSYEKAIETRELAKKLPETLMCFLGASGKSVKIVCRGELFPDLSADEQAVVDTLRQHGSMHINQLAEALRQPVYRLMGTLVDLDCRGVIATLPGCRYTLP